MLRTACPLVLAVAFGFSFAANAQDAHPVLKAHATVNSDVVKVGDLVDNAGIIAKVAIFRAPDLGTTGHVPADAVAAAVQKYALVGLDTAGLSEVTVTRAARTIPAKQIEETVAEALATQYQLGAAKDLTVTFDGVLNAVNVDPAALGDPRVARVLYDARSGRFDALLDLPASSSMRGTLRLAGRAIATVAVATLAHTVERGSVLKDADVVIERRPRSEVGRDALTDADAARGLAARSNLQAGHILRAVDLTRPDLVQRNDIVTLTYSAPGITLTMRGKALDNGAEGDAISVLNEQSKRTLQGIVTGPGRVSFTTEAPRYAANVAR